MKRLIAGALFVLAVPAFAQKDFLTSDEVEKVREAQLPNDRLKLYLLFARQRLDQLDRLLAKEKKGRSLTARELLEQYTEIIDAIDTVSDDAIKRGVDIAEGGTAVTDGEKRFLAQLQKIHDKPPSDLDLYEVALKEAMASTTDSLDLSKQDLSARATKLSDEDKKLKEEAEADIAAEDAKGKPAAAAKNGEGKPADDKAKRKPPTLMRKGEEAPTTGK